MHRIALTLVALMTLQQSAQAVFVEFRLDAPNGTLLADTYTYTALGVVDGGVTFDATVTVTGSADLTQLTTGLGVLGGSSDLLNSGEWLEFTMSVSNVVGGVVVFNGFTALDLNNFTALADTSILSTSANPVDQFAIVDTDPFAVAASPTSFFLIGDFGGDFPGTSFRVDDITGMFTGSTLAATPEPTSLALLMLGMTGGAWGYRRRQRRNGSLTEADLAASVTGG